jgi:hypothetical protein
MTIGESRNVFYLLLAIIVFLLLYSNLRRRQNLVPELEVKLMQRQLDTSDYRYCSTDSCLKLDRCLYDMDRIRVYVQPMVKILYQVVLKIKLIKNMFIEWKGVKCTRICRIQPNSSVNNEQ